MQFSSVPYVNFTVKSNISIRITVTVKDLSKVMSTLYCTTKASLQKYLEFAKQTTVKKKLVNPSCQMLNFKLTRGILNCYLESKLMKFQIAAQV